MNHPTAWLWWSIAFVGVSFLLLLVLSLAHVAKRADQQAQENFYGYEESSSPRFDTKPATYTFSCWRRDDDFTWRRHSITFRARNVADPTLERLGAEDSRGLWHDGSSAAERVRARPNENFEVYPFGWGRS